MILTKSKDIRDGYIRSLKIESQKCALHNNMIIEVGLLSIKIIEIKTQTDRVGIAVKTTRKLIINCITIYTIHKIW